MSVVTYTAQWVFWMSAFLVTYAYFLYPAILFVVYSVVQTGRDLGFLNRRHDRRTRAVPTGDLPGISMIVPAYNEEADLPGKIANLDTLDYPADRLEVIFVSDASSDRTDEILHSIDDLRVRAFRLPERGGKSAALNHAIERASHEIVVFSDASTLFAPESLRHLVRHFENPRVGAVCGALQFRGPRESAQTEGVYWKYESIIRLMEGRLDATLTASGAIYALRRCCYQPLSRQTLVDDFVVPMRARRMGYSVVYDPEAIAIEFAAPSVGAEFTRRVRLALGSFRALPELIRARLRGFALFAFLSHKVLRWFAPLLLLGMLLSSALLANRSIYLIALAAQFTSYLWALVGWLLPSYLRRMRFGLLGYFWVAMNAAFLVGFTRYLFGARETTWKTVR